MLGLGTQDEKMQFQSVDDMRKEAQRLSTAGQFKEAIELQRAVVEQLTPKHRNYVQEVKVLVAYYFNLKDFASALELMEGLRKRAPTDPEVVENLGVLYFFLNRLPEAAQAFEKAVSMAPEKVNIHDGLAHVHGRLRNLEKSKYHGEQSLILKDKAADPAVVHPIPKEPPPPFSYKDPSRNIIAFSLWGTERRYYEGIQRNTILARDIYPGWRCRVYLDDSVVPDFVNQLLQRGTQVVKMERPKHAFAGLFWRFAISDDPNVDRFIVRDGDAVINVKERVAVDEWLASDKYFHVMRDFYSHTEVMHAGLWGGVAGVLPPLNTLLKQFKTSQTPTRTYDQQFLREVVWPTVRQSCLIHDSCYEALGARKFPPYGHLPPNRHVGQDEWAITQAAAARGQHQQVS